MLETVVHTGLGIASVYAVCGVLFGVAFVTQGVNRIDAAARNAGIGFRLLLLPGTIAFWPWLLMKWLRSVPR